VSRLDRALVDRNMLGSRSRAAREIAAGRVDVNGRTVTKAAHEVAETDALTVTEPDPWVARSAHKLLGALEAFDLAPADLTGLSALDAGASTGGFTQVLLHCGLAEVWAVDVGHDQLAPMLREDPRVHVREGLNLRELARTPTYRASTSSSPTSPSSRCACSSNRCCSRPPASTGQLLLMVKTPIRTRPLLPSTSTASSHLRPTAAVRSTPS
jgi:23S rRNA (cytidine1920-2'-O)/16S rRNA (cytidine1409-2'-O)-methyltransferase